jgi:5-methylcytosine-specific restriction endonuclease McrA
MKVYRRTHYVKHRDRLLAEAKAWLASLSPESRALHLAKRRDTRKPVTDARRAQMKESARLWAERNPERKRVVGTLAQHALRGRGHVKVDDWLGILDSFDGRCAYCGVLDEMTIDHVIPFAGGGTHSPDNIVPACGSCNHVKRTSGPLAMVNRNFQLRTA